YSESFRSVMTIRRPLQMNNKESNQPGAVNGGTALRFQVERARPAVTDPERSARVPCATAAVTESWAGNGAVSSSTYHLADLVATGLAGLPQRCGGSPR